MGYRFAPRHGNIVVFLTTPAAEPPRLDGLALRSFLRAICADPDRSWRDGGLLLSRNRSWLQHLRIEASRAVEPLERNDERTQYSSSEVANILRPLRNLLSQFRLFAMPLWSGKYPDDHLMIHSEFLALHADSALVLIPEEGLDEVAEAGFDALPAFELALRRRGEWPGALLWTARGAAAFVTMPRVEDAFYKCHQVLRNRDDATLDRVLHALGARGPRGARQILHLSDLHFGADHAAINAPLLEAELSDTVQAVDRVVITGDLFQNPSSRDFADYQRFAQAIHRATGEQPICVPGNHDIRWLGNIGSNSTQIAALPWSSHVVDDTISTIFLGVNSAERGHMARGEVGQTQLTRLAAEHRNAITIRPELRDYLTVGLLHHHPYPFESTPSSLVQRLLATIGLSDEPFLCLVDADQYVEWCARWGVSVMLHGHKHVPRYEVRSIAPAGAAVQQMVAVGCGSSLGAEGTPMSYVILTWDEYRKKWSVSFFESRAGGPFVPLLISVTRDVSVSAEASE